LVDVRVAAGLAVAVFATAESPAEAVCAEFLAEAAPLPEEATFALAFTPFAEAAATEPATARAAGRTVVVAAGDVGDTARETPRPVAQSPAMKRANTPTSVAAIRPHDGERRLCRNIGLAGLVSTGPPGSVAAPPRLRRSGLLCLRAWH
jgi:hypothetical protein